MLSWYDQPRDASGHAITTGSAPPLVATIYAEDWTTLKSQSVALVPVTVDTVWSERRVMGFTVSAAGNYRVAFQVSQPSEGLGSVAIANAQLEKAQSETASPTAYRGTTSSREYLSSECKNRTGTDVQKAFSYHCESEGNCYYELNSPISINTEPQPVRCGMESPASVIRKKLAQGNYNYRHLRVYVNLVGTGVHSCSQTENSSCYGSGFTEYTLEHNASSARVLGWNGTTQKFNFGTAKINHGKALAAERYISVPVGSSDQQLLGQAGVEKVEYRGRPLDGTYRLGIWDSPALVWSRLEDVQIILKYRYWSPISGQAKGF